MTNIRQKGVSRQLKSIIPFIALVIVIALFSVLSPDRFLTVNNFRLLLQQSAITMIAGFGMTFVIVQGSIDLSIGSVLALSGLMGASVAQSFGWLGLPTAIFVGFLCGLCNGGSFAFLKIPSFIATLAMMLIARGLSIFYTKGMPIYLSSHYQHIGRWPWIIIVALLVFIFALVLYNYTKFGRYCRAIGGDERVAELSGITTKFYKLWVLTLCGSLTGLAGFVMAARVGAGTATIGAGFELDVIGCVVLGGTPLTGGIGKIEGTIVGALIVSILGNGLIILGVSSDLQMVLKGIILIIAVFLSLERGKIGIVK